MGRQEEVWRCEMARERIVREIGADGRGFEDAKSKSLYGQLDRQRLFLSPRTHTSDYPSMNIFPAFPLQDFNMIRY